MGDQPISSDPAPAVLIVGLGPAGLDRLPASTLDLLMDPQRRVILRTLSHPAAAQLAAGREVESCDDLYEASETFEDVYDAIARRVLAAAPVVYAVPGSPYLGELAVGRIVAAGDSVVVMPAESFLDAVLAAVGYDPLDRGLQLLDGHQLPTPLNLALPTVIGHLDAPMVMADVAARLGRVMGGDGGVTMVVDAGSPDQQVWTGPLDDLPADLASFRTSMFVDTAAGGLAGAVATMWRLRRECPWDRSQTHQSLIPNLVEESYELADALAALPSDEAADAEPDWMAYTAVEEELGDVLLQVLFHAGIAAQAGVFDIDDVGEALRQKLVRRHPHVFGEVDASTPEEVKTNWHSIKQGEKGPDTSLLGGVPEGLPATVRAERLQSAAATIGFDWPDARPVIAKLEEEIGELAAVIDDPERAGAELGDLLFTAVNLARHIGADPETVLRQASQRFAARFAMMEAMGPLEGLTLAELDARWDLAKAGEGTGPSGR
ncbi:MAG TPA: nucleoside triphosphate pyrophosphohydrolase [Acidimicrobiia bacterium]